MMFTIDTMTQRFKERLNLYLPHPRRETVHRAEDLGVNLPCSYPNCPIGYKCGICDQIMGLTRVTDAAQLPEYLVSENSTVRDMAREMLGGYMHP